MSQQCSWPTQSSLRGVVRIMSFQGLLKPPAKPGGLTSILFYSKGEFTICFGERNGFSWLIRSADEDACDTVLDFFADCLAQVARTKPAVLCFLSEVFDTLSS